VLYSSDREYYRKAIFECLNNDNHNMSHVNEP